MTKNDDLREWNEAIAQGDELLSKMRHDVIRTKDGWVRRMRVRLMRSLEAWVARGRRWRDEDMRE